MKIIYIAGDGRSGSTLLDSILSNIDGSLSVGECHRFWIRFYEGETHCACGKMITDCELWSDVDIQLRERFDDYAPEQFKKRVIEIQQYRNFKKIPVLVASQEWQSFCEQVKAFYEIIASHAKNKVIIDSSKSISWAYFLEQLAFSEIYIIHLERNLPSVANSWRKKILLPEYSSKEVYMPVKSILLSTKSWVKIKVMAKRLKRADHYLFVSYEKLCKQPDLWLKKIKSFVNEDLNLEHLQMLPTHAIGGNPMRAKNNDAIRIEPQKDRFKNLNPLQLLFLKAVNGFAKTFLS